MPEFTRNAMGDYESTYSARVLPWLFQNETGRLGIRVTRTKPRHAWTNGFVERLQKMILHEHWRIAFRRQYFTSRRSLQGSLDRFLQFYNHERPHSSLGYRPPALVANRRAANHA